MSAPNGSAAVHLDWSLPVVRPHAFSAGCERVKGCPPSQYEAARCCLLLLVLLLPVLLLPVLLLPSLWRWELCVSSRRDSL